MEYKLSELFDLQMGKTPDRKNNTFWNTKDNKWLSIADLSKSNKYVSITKEYISDEAVAKSGIKVIPADTVVMSFKLSIGKVAICKENLYSNEAIMAFLDKGKIKILSDYLYYLLLSKDWDEGSNKAVMGHTLNKATLSDMTICVHDIKEQQQIADTLDRVSHLISLRSQQLEKLDSLVKSRFVEMFGDLAKGEYRFSTKKLGEVAKVGSSHRVFTTEFVEKGIPFYRGTEIGLLANGLFPEEPYYISEEHYNRLSSDDSKPLIGDLLLPSICDKGQVWMVDTEKPFYYKDGRVLCVSADRSLLNTKYLQYYMRMKTEIEYPKLGSGSTFAEFKIFLLKDIDVVMPPRMLQDNYADFVQQVDKSKFAIKKSLEKLELLKKKLMQDYFG